MKYLFQITMLDQELLLPQLSQALQKRSELISRQKYPALWQRHDRITDLQKMPAAILRRRRLRFRIYGIILLALGLFLLIPALTAPQELPVPLLAGIVAIITAVFALHLAQNRDGKAPLRRRFDKAAQKLLTHQQQALPAEIGFTEEGMQLTAEKIIPYSAIDCFIISDAAFLLTWQGQVVFLPKSSLQDDSACMANSTVSQSGDTAINFSHFLVARIPHTALRGDIRPAKNG